MESAYATSSWLPPGGSCHDEISASRNRYFVVTDEGRRWLKVLDFPVKWRKPEHIPLIQLHSFTNLSPPLISLAFTRQLFDFGLIATGNHNFEKFAALCNAPGGSQGCFAPGNGGRLRASPTDSEDFGDTHSTKHSIARASGRQVGDPYSWRYKTGCHTIQRRTLPQLRYAQQLPQRGSQGGCAAAS